MGKPPTLDQGQRVQRKLVHSWLVSKSTVASLPEDTPTHPLQTMVLSRGTGPRGASTEAALSTLRAGIQLKSYTVCDACAYTPHRSTGRPVTRELNGSGHRHYQPASDTSPKGLSQARSNAIRQPKW